MPSIRWFSISAPLCFVFFVSTASAQTIRFADDDGTPGNGCTSWADACPDLQTALRLGLSGDQIWVTSGAGQTVSVDFVGQWGGQSSAVAVQGNYCYVGMGARLLVFDVSDPPNLTLVGGTPMFPGTVEDLVVSGNYAYVVGDEWAGLLVIDVSDPSNPQWVGTGPYGLDAYGVALTGNYPYVAFTYIGLHVFDVSDPSNPEWPGGYDPGPALTWDVAVSGDYACGVSPARRTTHLHPGETSGWSITIYMEDNNQDGTHVSTLSRSGPPHPEFEWASLSVQRGQLE